MADKDITLMVQFGENDGEMLPLTRCVCGEKFGHLEFVLHEGKDYNYLAECDNCNRKMYFVNNITVYEVVEE